MDPHAETSFSPSRPSIIGFVCTDIDKAAQAAGKTIIVDGFKSWSTLSLNLREKLQSSYLEYDLNISLNSSKESKALDQGRGIWIMKVSQRSCSILKLNHKI